jgi:hypothetical protein
MSGRPFQRQALLDKRTDDCLLSPSRLASASSLGMAVNVMIDLAHLIFRQHCQDFGRQIAYDVSEHLADGAIRCVCFLLADWLEATVQIVSPVAKTIVRTLSLGLRILLRRHLFSASY